MKSIRSEKLTTITLSVFKLNGQLIEWGNHFSRPHELTSARWQVMGAIVIANQPSSVPQIAAAMGLTRQGVMKQIRLLVDEGLVEPRTNPAHKCSLLYTLTPGGQIVYQALEKRWQKHAHSMAREFSVTELDTVIRVLAAMSRIHDITL